MSNKSMPLFTSAPRLTLSLDDGAIIGFAIGFNLNISVDVQPIYTLGLYGPAALEPTYYNQVTGTFQIIRLSRPDSRSAFMTAAGTMDLLEDKVTNPAKSHDWIGGTEPTSANGVLNQSISNASVTPMGLNNLYYHLDPSLVLVSSLFDMTMQIRTPVVTQTDTNVTPPTKLTTGKKTVAASATFVMKNWMFIRQCRITGRNTNITMGQVVNEPLNFTGLFVTPSLTDGTTGDMFSPDVGFAQGKE